MSTSTIAENLKDSGSSGSGKEVDPTITTPDNDDPNNVPSEPNEGQETPAP